MIPRFELNTHLVFQFDTNTFIHFLNFVLTDTLLSVFDFFPDLVVESDTNTLIQCFNLKLIHCLVF